MRLKFSIAALLLLTGIVAIGIRIYQTSPTFTETESISKSDEVYDLIVSTGKLNGRLVVVGICGKSKNKDGTNSSIISSRASLTPSGQPWNKLILHRPDGSREALPNGYQLFQFIDGDWTQMKSDVTISEYEKFCNSNPPQFTIQALAKFVKSLRHSGTNG